MSFSPEDKTHLDAADGWIGLGNFLEANAELEEISASMRAAPEVLTLRWKIYSGLESWPLAIEVARTMAERFPDEPTWHMNHAYALRAIDRIEEAVKILRGIEDQFPDCWLLHFRLACYHASLGQSVSVLCHLERAIDVAGKLDIRSLALEEPALQKFWAEIGEI